MKEKPSIQVKRRSRLWFLVPILVVALAAGVAARRARRAYVEVGSVERGRIVEAIYGLGTVTAQNKYQVKMGLTARIGKVFVKEGDAVRKGDKLVAMEGATTFAAPFDGTVTSIPFKEGETAFPQLPVLTLTDLVHKYIVVSLDQRAAMKVRHGQPATLSFEGNRESPVQATVTSVYPNDGQFLVRVDSEEIPPTALPGMTVDVAIEIGAKEGVLIAPAAAVQKDTVLVGEGHRPVKVATGLVDGAKVEIVGGEVKEQDRLFVRAK